MASPAQPLDLDHGWGIGEESFRRVVEQMRQDLVREVVEFGSGASSIRLAQALPETRILSIESNTSFYQDLVRKVREHRVDGTLSVELRPLRWQWYGGSAFLSYAVGSFPPAVDAVLIDGPPAWTRRGREACLYQVVSRLRVGGRVYLDDFARRREKRIVRNWILAFPGCFRTTIIEAGHGLCVLEKFQQTSAPRFSLTGAADHLVQMIRLFLSHPVRRS